MDTNILTYRNMVIFLKLAPIKNTFLHFFFTEDRRFRLFVDASADSFKVTLFNVADGAKLLRSLEAGQQFSDQYNQ